MRLIRYLLALVIVLFLMLFVALRPVSGPVTQTDLPAVTDPSTLAACAGSPPSRLAAGREARVALPGQGEARHNLMVRAEPGGEAVGRMEPGTPFRITGESRCDSEGLRWWPIESEDFAGWSVEGFAPDDYLMEPVDA